MSACPHHFMPQPTPVAEPAKPQFYGPRTYPIYEPAPGPNLGILCEARDLIDQGIQNVDAVVKIILASDPTTALAIFFQCHDAGKDWMFAVHGHVSDYLVKASTSPAEQNRIHMPLEAITAENEAFAAAWIQFLADKVSTK